MTRFRFLDAQGVATPDPAQTVVFQDLETRLDWIATPIMLASQREIEAQASAIGLLGGGWLAPSRVQLLTLVDDTRFRPATFPELASFTPLDDWYWTVTPAAHSPVDGAWSVYFGSGYSGWVNRDHSGFLRAVRPSQ